MNSDDVIYVGLLTFSIIFGFYYRTVEDRRSKQLIGTNVGVAIILLVSNWHTFHLLVTFSINTLIILYLSKKSCHIASFIFSFLYLLFFRTTLYFGIPYPPAHTNLLQMILTLKMVGLAFEVNNAYYDYVHNEDENEENQLPERYNILHLDFKDILHYTFNYVGILTGPYYRYRTYVDHLDLPFSKYADWKKATRERLQFVPLYAACYLLANHYWPSSYATTVEFYEQTSWLYRYWYIWPTFFTFRMRIYIGLVLSECVCTMAGLGAYPIFTNPKPGQGPSENLERMEETLDTLALQGIDYNFETVINIRPYQTEFCTTYREAMKNWNICIQYWLAVNVYKRFPLKKYRTIVTMVVSSYWHGVYLGYYVCIGTAAFVLALENVYYKTFLKDKTSVSKLYLWIHWLARMHFFSYQSIAFLLLDVSTIFNYYNSIYHAGLIVGIILYLAGLQLKRRRRENRTD